jgi:hypothetical protein
MRMTRKEKEKEEHIKVGKEELMLNNFFPLAPTLPESLILLGFFHKIISFPFSIKRTSLILH